MNNPGFSAANQAPEIITISFHEVLNGVKEHALWLEDRGDAGLVCLFANDSFLEKVGYSSEEVIGRSLVGLVESSRYETLKNLIEELKNGPRANSEFSNVIRLSFRNGKDYWTEFSCYVFVCTVKGVCSVVLYCTEPDQHFGTYFRSSQLYEEALDGIFTLHRYGKIRNGNKKIEQLMGRRDGDLTVDYFDGFLPKKKALGLIKFLRLCLKGELENYPYYVNNVSPDGEEKHYSVRAIRSPLTESEVIVYIRDISNVKKLENDLRESESKYRSVVEQSRDIICLSVRDKIILANSVAYNLLGDQLRKEDINWKDYGEKIIPGDRDRVVTFLRHAFRNLVEESDTGNMSTEFKLNARNGVVLDMGMTVSAITFQREKALFCTIRDITESKRLEEKTKESIKLGTLAQFAASVAHEIRNPLEALTSAGLLLSRGLELEGESKQLLDVILSATDDINRVVNEFVSMTSRPAYEFSRTDIKVLLNSAMKIVKRLKSYDPRVSLVASCQRGLPEINCDAGQLRIMLANVINNAVSAIPGKGRIEIRAEKTLLNGRDALQIVVKDNGKGIAPEILSQIWEPFVTSKKKGMGLGLFLAKHCIEDHGGHIDIPSSNDKGTTVRIVLPILPQASK